MQTIQLVDESLNYRTTQVNDHCAFTKVCLVGGWDPIASPTALIVRQLDSPTRQCINKIGCAWDF